MEPSARDIINRAREILERDGWCQGSAHKDDGTHCTMGALSIAADELQADPAVTTLEGQWCPVRGSELYMEAARLVSGQLGEGYPKGAGSGAVPVWNDLDTTTLEDVMLVLKKAVHDN